MVRIGEQSGTLESMLNKMASMYEQEVDHIIDQLGTLLEPFLMLLLGGVIGLLVVALY